VKYQTIIRYNTDNFLRKLQQILNKKKQIFPTKKKTKLRGRKLLSIVMVWECDKGNPNIELRLDKRIQD